MTQKHTPAPWHRDGSLVLSIIEKRTGGFDKTLVAQTSYASTYKTPNIDECRANAHLIASAPELLEELKDINNKLISLANSKTTSRLIASRIYEVLGNTTSIIAKAEGR